MKERAALPDSDLVKAINKRYLTRRPEKLFPQGLGAENQLAWEGVRRSLAVVPRGLRSMEMVARYKQASQLVFDFRHVSF